LVEEPNHRHCRLLRTRRQRPRRDRRAAEKRDELGRFTASVSRALD
jgi:hypothetical protein